MRDKDNLLTRRLICRFNVGLQSGEILIPDFEVGIRKSPIIGGRECIGPRECKLQTSLYRLADLRIIAQGCEILYYFVPNPVPCDEAAMIVSVACGVLFGGFPSSQISSIKPLRCTYFNAWRIESCFLVEHDMSFPT